MQSRLAIQPSANGTIDEVAIMDDAHRARLATLDALFGHPALGRQYVLKGGLPLHHVYGNPRRSDDLDFNSVAWHPNRVAEGEEHLLVTFAHALNEALAAAAPRWGWAALAVQHKRLSDVLPTLLAEVGYTADERATPPFETAVEMQATLSEVVCAWQRAKLDGVGIAVPTVEDIAADKLKTLLQQAAGDAEPRTTDVWDLYFLVTRKSPDAARVRAFLEKKCAVWPDLAGPSPAHFHAADVRRAAAEGYAGLPGAHPELDAPPFDEAFGAVLAFVDAMEG